jgi:hypothetical protein
LCRASPQTVSKPKDAAHEATKGAGSLFKTGRMQCTIIAGKDERKISEGEGMGAEKVRETETKEKKKIL